MAVVTNYAPFTSTADALIKLLYQQAALPPKPLIRIKGTHGHDFAIQTDFDLTLNMQSLLVPSGTERWNYLKVTADDRAGPVAGPSSTTTSPEKWAARFIADRSKSKEYGSLVCQ